MEPGSQLLAEKPTEIRLGPDAAVAGAMPSPGHPANPGITSSARAGRSR